MTLLGNLFGQLFGDSAAESEARGDQFAAVNNWRRAYEEYERALHKSSRGTVSHRRIASKLDEARVQGFDSLLEDIHSRIDVREYTYASEQIAWARELVESEEQLERLRECESRLRTSRRTTSRPAESKSAARVESAPREASETGADTAAEAPAERKSRKKRPRAPAAEPAAAVSTRNDALGSVEEQFRALLRDWPAEEREARAALGTRYQEAALDLGRRPQRTVEVLQEMVRENPDATDVVFDLGRALDAAERPQDAVDLYARCIDREPEDWRAWYELSQLLWRRGRSEDCLQCLRQGLDHNPRSGHLMAQWAVCLYKLGRPRQALEKFYLALQLDAFDDVGLYHTIGSLHHETHDVDKARRAYLKALELDTDSAGTRLDYAEMLLERNDTAGAKEVLDPLLRASRGGVPSSYHAYASYLSSRVHMAQDERELALLAISRAIEDNDLDWLEPTLEEQRAAVMSV